MFGKGSEVASWPPAFGKAARPNRGRKGENARGGYELAVEALEPSSFFDLVNPAHA